MWWIAGSAAGAALGMAAWMVVEAYRSRLIKEEVKLDRLPASFDGLRLLFISDIHRRTVPERLIRAVVAAGGADIVCIGGDLKEGGVPLDRSRDNLRALARIAPVYAVYGNHDYDEPIGELDALLRQEGVRPLVNEYVLVSQPDGSQIKLCGLDDPITGRARLSRALQNGEGGGEAPFTLLLSHDPNILDRLEGAAIDLILSGHTHGGQITLPIYGPLLRSPEIVTYLSGWHKAINNKLSLQTRLYVSTGFGTSKLPIRLGAPAEVRLFTLRSEAHSEA